jgi:hypothetical protein
MTYHARPRDGLYLVTQRSPAKGVDHYGVVDCGNHFGFPHYSALDSVVFHQTPPRMRCDWVQYTGSWKLLDRIVDEAGARTRLLEVLANKPGYHLIVNNCEHVARYVAYGKSESSQLTAGVALVGLTVLGVLAISSSDAG